MFLHWAGAFPDSFIKQALFSDLRIRQIVPLCLFVLEVIVWWGDRKINKEIYGMVSGDGAKDKSRKGEWEL